MCPRHLLGCLQCWSLFASAMPRAEFLRAFVSPPSQCERRGTSTVFLRILDFVSIAVVDSLVVVTSHVVFS